MPTSSDVSGATTSTVQMGIFFLPIRHSGNAGHRIHGITSGDRTCGTTQTSSPSANTCGMTPGLSSWAGKASVPSGARMDCPSHQAREWTARWLRIYGTGNGVVRFRSSTDGAQPVAFPPDPPSTGRERKALRAPFYVSRLQAPLVYGLHRERREGNKRYQCQFSSVSSPGLVLKS